MASTLIDPNNLVPDVSPNDGWGDFNDRHAPQVAPIAKLPPKRKAHSSRRDTPREGLRIDTSNISRVDHSEKSQLEVMELNVAVVKLVPEIEEPQKIPRLLTFREKKPSTHTHRDAEDGGKWGNSGKSSMFWILGASAGVISIVVLALLALPFINQTHKAKPLPGEASFVLQADDLPAVDMESAHGLLTRQSEAEQLFHNFASAGIIDDFLPSIRHADSLAPLIRNRPLSTRVPRDWVASEHCTWNVFELEGFHYAFLEGILPDFSMFRAGFVMEGKRLCLDWKATTSYGTATFAELAESHGDPSEIRGWLIPSSFYTATFPEEDFQSYQFLSPNEETTLWCYTAKNGPIAPSLSRMFQRGDILKPTNDPKPVTLKLERSPAGALPNQWLIGKMLHKEWISP